MRIPLTDKFLWDLYNLMEKIGDALEVPEIFRIKGFNEICNPGQFEYWQAYRRRKKKKQFAQFMHYLKRQGYIKIKSLSEGKGILLTPKGEQKALKAKYRLTEPKFKKRKDKKWTMVVYDIPENKREYRDNLRAFLNSLGFQKFQQSIWISPYDVYKEIERIIRIYSLNKFVRIFLIKEIEI